MVDAIVAIRTENPGYSPRKIANMVKSQLEFAIDKKTVAKILKAHGFKAKPTGKRPPREQDPD